MTTGTWTQGVDSSQTDILASGKACRGPCDIDSDNKRANGGPYVHQSRIWHRKSGLILVWSTYGHRFCHQAVAPEATGRLADGLRAFLPKPLPPDPLLWTWTSRFRCCSPAPDQSLGRLDGAVQILPDSDLFVFMFMRREAVLSSQIEGTQKLARRRAAGGSRDTRSGPASGCRGGAWATLRRSGTARGRLRRAGACPSS